MKYTNARIKNALGMNKIKPLEDIPLPVVYKWLLRDYHKLLNRNEQLEAENKKLKKRENELLHFTPDELIVQQMNKWQSKITAKYDKKIQAQKDMIHSLKKTNDELIIKLQKCK